MALAEHFPPYIAPSVSTIQQAFSQIIQERDFWAIILPTIQKVLLGFSISLVVGLLLGILIERSRFLRQVFYPVLIIAETTPPISWIVLAIVWFGLGSGPPIMVQILTCVPIITITTYQGIKSVDKSYGELVSIYNISLWDNVRHILLPAAAPSIFGGMKVSLGLSWRIVVTAEFFASSKGLGYYISWSHSNTETDLTIAYTLFVIILALLTEYLLLTPLERFITRWHEN